MSGNKKYHYAVLNREWMLRGWNDVKWGLVNYKTGQLRILERDGFYVASSCDGITNFSSFAFLPRHIALLERYIAEGIVIESEYTEAFPEYQKYRKADNPLIMEINWAMTGRCNLNCRHCFMESSRGRYGEPSLQEAEHLLEQFEKANVISVSLTGGEPFIRDDFLQIVEELSRKKINISQIVTNGTLISSAALRDITALGQRPGFNISFDGVGTHDNMRGTIGSEKLAIEGICKVRDAGLTVTVTTSVDRCNCDSMLETYELMKNLRVPVWLIGRPQTVGNWRNSATALNTGEMSDICIEILRCWLNDGRPLSIMLEQFFSGGAGKAVNKKVPVCWTRDSYECSSIREKPFLLPDGTLLPCTGVTGTYIQDRMPNLKGCDLSSALKEPEYRSFVDMTKNEVLQNDSECAACPMFSECGAGCRAYALTESGKFFAKDPIACAMWKGGYKKKFDDIVKEYDKSM